MSITSTLNVVKNSIVKGLRAYDAHIQESYRPLFRNNADEVIAVTYGVIAISTVQYVIDWKKHGYKKARNNNAKLALGLVVWQLVKVPEVENKIAQTLENFSNKLSAED